MSNRTTVSMAGLLVVGIIIGAVVFYSSFAAAGRTLTTYSTSVVTSATTSTAVVTATSTSTATFTSTVTSTIVPPVATVSVAGVYFPAAGTNGTVTLFNSGAAGTTVVSASLTYSGQTCSLGAAESNTAVNPGFTTMTWSYTGGSACPNAPGASGGNFAGSLTFANGAQLAFAGAFK